MPDEVNNKQINHVSYIMSRSVSSTNDLASGLSDTTPLSQTPEDEMTERRETATLSLITYLLVCCFAVSSWVAVSGLWVELPLFVQELPEGWALPSYLVIIIQLANIGPIVYGLVKSRLRSRLPEEAAVGAIIATGAGACLMLAFFWRRTTVVSGERHSVALVALTGVLALVDCTSSVVYLPFMAAFPPRYITAFYIGEGLSGLVPGLASIVQGVSGRPTCVNRTKTVHSTTGVHNTMGVYNTTAVHDILTELVPVYAEPLFSVAAFFVFLSVIVCFSGIAFVGLTKLPRCRLEMAKTHLDKSGNYQDDTTYTSSSAAREETMAAPTAAAENVDHVYIGCAQYDTHCARHDTDDDSDDRNQHCSVSDAPPLLSSSELLCILTLTAWINALTNGVLPALQSYACLPYGYRAFNLAVKLSTIANPVACLFCFFRRLGSISSIGYMTTVASVISAYLVYLAAVSPTPPLQTRWTGQALVVSINDIIKVKRHMPHVLIMQYEPINICKSVLTSLRLRESYVVTSNVYVYTSLPNDSMR